MIGNRTIKTKKIKRKINRKRRNSNAKKRNAKVGGNNGKVKRTLKKIKKKMSSSLKYVSGKMTKIFTNISKKFKLSNYNEYFLRLKEKNPEKFKQINKVANFKFEQLKKGDKQTIKIIDEITSHPDASNHLVKMKGGDFGVDCKHDYMGETCKYTAKEIVKDILRLPLKILLNASILAIIKWKCWKGTMPRNFMCNI